MNRTFATVMHHDGEDLQKAVKEAGVSIGRFAKMMSVERSTPPRWFGLPILPSDRRLEAAKVLRLSPEDIFKRLVKRDEFSPPTLSGPPLDTARSQSGPKNQLQEPISQYRSTALLPDYETCLEERDKWRTLAYENLAKYNELLVEHNQLLRLARLGSGYAKANMSQ